MKTSKDIFIEVREKQTFSDSKKLTESEKYIHGQFQSKNRSNTKR